MEAPERFRAIQTYRACTAVLKQQMAFIKTMYESGIVDDMERDELLRYASKQTSTAPIGHWFSTTRTRFYRKAISACL